MGKLFYLLLIAQNIENIVYGNRAAALRHVLVDILHESEFRLLLVSDFDDAHPVFLLYAEVLERLAHDVHYPAIFICRPIALAGHDVAMQIVEQLVFIHQVVERFRLVLLLAVLLFAEENLAEGHEHDDADGDDDETHGEEGEESERLISCFCEHLVDDQVGRCTYECEHSSETARKGKGHEETARLHARCCR